MCSSMLTLPSWSVQALTEKQMFYVLWLSYCLVKKKELDYQSYCDMSFQWLLECALFLTYGFNNSYVLHVQIVGFH